MGGYALNVFLYMAYGQNMGRGYEWEHDQITNLQKFIVSNILVK